MGKKSANQTNLQAKAASSQPVSNILQAMQGQTITEGWDVVCAMAAAPINLLLGQQYVLNLNNQNNIYTINDLVSIGGGVAVQFIDVVLGPPLVSFSGDITPAGANLTIYFLSGMVNMVKVENEVTTILSSQIITQSDNYALTGILPLSSIQGKVTNGQDVVLDITNGKFVANLNLSAGAQTALGEYFQTWLQNNIEGACYVLGTIITTDNQTNLTPVFFDFSTQAGSDSSDSGRLLLFIATKYNPDGGTQPPGNIIDFVPDGYSSALIVSSKALFEGILQPQISAQLAKYGLTSTAASSSSTSAYQLNVTGSADIGEIDYEAPSARCFSGYSSSEYSYTQTPVSVPLTDSQLSPQGEGVALILNSSWVQDSVYGIINPKGGWDYSGGTIKIKASASNTNTASVDPAKDIVSFTGAIEVEVKAEKYHFHLFGPDSQVVNALGSMIQSATEQVFANILNFDLPEVNTFAVSNLLFPGQSILSFQNAYVPGDLLLVGDVQVPSVVSAPLMVTLSNAQTQQFNATSPPNINQGVEWFVSGLGVDNPAAGTISQQGLYTAPDSISSPQVDVVTAMCTADQTTSSSIVTLVPAEILVSPLFVLITPDSSEAQQFTAVMPMSVNQEMDWSINPQVGSINNGNYTPPSTINEPTAVILSAASTTDSGIQGTALIALLPSDPQLINVNPSITPSPLSASQTCAFQASTPLQPVNWFTLPEIGSISQNGLYTAPEQIDQLQTVLVVASATWNDTTYYGTGLVILSPA